MHAQTKYNSPEKQIKSKPHFQVLDGLRGMAALVFLFFHYIMTNPELSMGDKYMIASCFILANIILAYAAMKLFDEPIRRWLRRIIPG